MRRLILDDFNIVINIMNQGNSYGKILYNLYILIIYEWVNFDKLDYNNVFN
jgi:hypothetical protein